MCIRDRYMGTQTSFSISQQFIEMASKIKEQEVFEAGVDYDYEEANEKAHRRGANPPKINEAELVTETNSLKDSYRAYADADRAFSVNNLDRGPKDLTETPLERLNRIKLEIQEFKDEMNTIVEKERDLKFANAAEKIDIIRELESLEKNVAEVVDNDAFKQIVHDHPGATTLSFDANYIAFKKSTQERVFQELLQKLDGFKQGETANDEIKNIKYELYLNKETANLKQAIKYEELERRLAQIEKYVGGYQPSPHGDLTNQYDRMSRILGQLEQGKLTGMEDRISKLASELESLDLSINKKNEQILNDAELRKIEEVYNAYNQVKGVLDEIPNLVDRFESLRIIHEESASLTTRLDSLKDNNAQLSEILRDNNSLLKKVEENFKQNAETISKNLANVEKRIDQLTKQQ
eukprot:TRINITY_DN282_c0_g1_i8.p1 TRINITY_DN282_c0_g1~~TRINITY_DN282_c0_g1_i8.p1  ORF type:complete len:437 (-),score=163.31 TRINITY_DN282_c0_g1_i8:38-1261(-)